MSTAPARLNDDAPQFALVALGRGKRSRRLASALAEAGYRSSCHDGLADLLGAIEPCQDAIAVVAELPSPWLPAVTDALARRPKLRLVLVIDTATSDEAITALRVGVAGLCATSASVDAIVRTVDDVASRRVAVPRTLVGPLVEELRRGRGHTLTTTRGTVEITDREWEIVQLLLQDRSTREIADALFVSVGTVRSHVWALVHKLGAADRDEAVALIRGA